MAENTCEKKNDGVQFNVEPKHEDGFGSYAQAAEALAQALDSQAEAARAKAKKKCDDRDCGADAKKACATVIKEDLKHPAIEGRVYHYRIKGVEGYGYEIKGSQVNKATAICECHTPPPKPGAAGGKAAPDGGAQQKKE